MELVEQIERDRANLVDALARMRAQLEQLSRQAEQQVGAIQYCDVLLERIKGGQNGNGEVAPPPLA